MALKMDEYINRGTAIAKLTALEVTEPNATMADAKRVLADMQTADVASVVRCKDCSWYQSVDDDGDDFEVCNYYNREVMGSQFCSEAEPYKTPEEKAEFRRSVGLDEGVAMAEYINRKALLQKAWDADTRIGYVQVVDVGDILDMPVADVAPVVHGRWVHLGGDEWCCSACGFVITTDGSWDKPTKKYCEDCGAKIDEKGDVYD
jgi:hypothetical protein